ncbi:MAG TPA: serine/threonine-protein kinase [Polyangia bacterium]|nr:serine/threonine-protein kinase [Polyangia bacterium]
MESLEIRPERFGRYILLDRIGSGGMAEVFRAVMPGVEGFQRTFVVKRILAERAQSPYFVDMFVQEARINALLHHPNIVQVFDFGNVGGTYFLAMEYVRGRDVSEILRRLRNYERPCPVGVAAFIAHEVAQALSYAHALCGGDGTPFNIVHRDVSPSNVICLRAGGVKLLDFGIAKALGEPEVEKTGQGLFKGKLSYIAPERIKDLPLDGRSDLFSLGVVLWELLAGQKLFRGKSDFQTLKNVAEMEIPAPSSLRPDVSPELDRVVARALARDPAQRYATGQELAEELDRVLETLRFQPRALPELLHELFGAELTSRQIPANTLTPEMLAACSTNTSGVVPPSGPTLAAPGRPAEADEYSISIGTRAPAGRARPGWLSWAAAAIGTVTLIFLAVARGGGGRSQGATLPRRAAGLAVAAAPSAALDPSPAVAAQPTARLDLVGPAPDPTASQVPSARAARRTRWSGKGRIARGLSVDPFAEAASRVGR